MPRVSRSILHRILFLYLVTITVTLCSLQTQFVPMGKSVVECPLRGIPEAGGAPREVHQCENQDGLVEGCWPSRRGGIWDEYWLLDASPCLCVMLGDCWLSGVVRTQQGAVISLYSQTIACSRSSCTLTAPKDFLSIDFLTVRPEVGESAGGGHGTWTQDDSIHEGVRGVCV